MVSFLDLFSAYLFCFSILFMFMPVFQIMEWRRRGTTEGFSSIHMVLPCLMMSCWLRHGIMTQDSMNTYINILGLGSTAVVLAFYAFYSPSIKNLSIQIFTLLATLAAIFAYVETHEQDEAVDVMGKVAALAQNVGLFGGIYQIKDVIDRKTTEYVPAEMQFGILVAIAQWTVYAILTANWYMAVANVPGLILSVVTISLYVVYPPISWRVPIIGTQQKPKAA